jgi:hypothetical protein
MLHNTFLAERFTHPLLLLKFKSDKDFGMAFCADLSPEGDLKGISLFYSRKSDPKVYRTKPEVVTSIFQPSLTADADKPRMFNMYLRPLEHAIKIVQKGEKFVCQYPFKNHGKIGKLTYVEVETIRSPLSVNFDVTATYRKSKDTSPEVLSEKIVAPEEFTNELYDLFMSY